MSHEALKARQFALFHKGVNTIIEETACNGILSQRSTVESNQSIGREDFNHEPVFTLFQHIFGDDADNLEFLAIAHKVDEHNELIYIDAGSPETRYFIQAGYTCNKCRKLRSADQFDSTEPLKRICDNCR